jgi:hypothetical protein
MWIDQAGVIQRSAQSITSVAAGASAIGPT